jgi:hypothetical protein
LDTATMAKKSAPKGRPRESGPRRTVLTIKGTDEWRVWLEGLGAHLRTPTSTVVDHALVRYAKEVGYTKEAPMR